MNPLAAYRRQFLITERPLEPAVGWEARPFGQWFIHTHPELGVHTARAGDIEAVLIGFALDPANTDASDSDIVATLAAADGSESRERILHRLSGRFVLGINTPRGAHFYSDASAFRTLVYTRGTSPFRAASDTALLARVTGLRDDARLGEYIGSTHFRNNTEHWLPAGVTLNESIDQLLPNHVLDVATRRQHRFWPNAPLKVASTPSAIEERSSMAAAIIRDSIVAASLRAPLALPITAGIDSRTLFAALRATGIEHQPFTCVYRWLNERSADVAVPTQLYDNGTVQQIPVPRKTPPEWERLYRAHTAQAHLEDAGRIAFAMHEALPPGLLALNGTAAETARGFFYQTHPPQITNVDDILALVPGWDEITFIRDSVQQWLDEARPVAQHFGYELTSLFYWEHRCGSWQAQSQTEWDLVFDAFTPFSNRALLEAMLSVPHELRDGPDHQLAKRIVEILDPAALTIPVNHPNIEEQARTFIWRAWRKLRRQATWRRRQEYARS